MTQSAPALPARMLIAANYNNGNLEYWPIVKHGGGTSPTPLVKGLGLKQPTSMAADGKVLAVTDNSQIILYDLTTMKQSALPDDYGTAIDVGVGKDETIYAVNFYRNSMSVVEYKHGETKPAVFYCPALREGAYIAVDNENDVFINGYPRAGGSAVFEFANGSKDCALVKLRPELGYAAGIAIDPKTDALLVLDNPSGCAGDPEGQLTIYPRPYRPATGVQRDLGGECPNGLRLNASSTAVFYGDNAGNDGGPMVIREAAYPFGTDRETYSGGQPLGFTTIPNTLPN